MSRTLFRLGYQKEEAPAGPIGDSAGRKGKLYSAVAQSSHAIGLGSARNAFNGAVQEKPLGRQQAPAGDLPAEPGNTSLANRSLQDDVRDSAVKKRQKKGTTDMAEEGKKAPDIKLPDQDGETFKLSGHKGQPIVVYFYPKDDTSGCTSEAKDFTEHLAQFDKAGVLVVGISPDSPAKHTKFRQKHDLGVRLLADEEKKAAEAYGVWVEKSMYGRKYMGVERSTFLIDAKGKVARAWRKVKVKGHVAEVLEAARALAG
jgi:peroxiredoxin Q/BCP